MEGCDHGPFEEMPSISVGAAAKSFLRSRSEVARSPDRRFVSPTKDPIRDGDRRKNGRNENSAVTAPGGRDRNRRRRRDAIHGCQKLPR